MANYAHDTVDMTGILTLHEVWSNATQPADPTPAGYTATDGDDTVLTTRELTDHEQATLAGLDDQRVQAQLQATLPAVVAVSRMVATERITAGTLPQAEAATLAPLFPAWEPDVKVAVGDIRTYQGAIYTCLQAHTTQADWTPDIVPALWAPYRDPAVIAEWVQPTGATDAYAKGAKVLHNGKTWVSNFDGANVWEPGATGITQWDAA